MAESESDTVECPHERCSKEVSFNARDLLKHILFFHKGEEVLVTCPLCKLSGLRVKGFETHMNTHHRTRPRPMSRRGFSLRPRATVGVDCDANVSTENGKNETDTVNTVNTEARVESGECDLQEVTYEDEDVNVNENLDSDDEEDCVAANERDNLKTPGSANNDELKQAMKFIMTMKAVCGVKHSQMNDVIQETEELFGLVFDKTLQKLRNLGCVFTKQFDLRSVKQEVCGTIFDGLRTRYRQDQYVEATYHVIKPKCVNISAKFKKVGEGKKRKTVLEEKNFYYVPVLQVLERLVNHPDYDVITKRKYDPDPNVLDGYLKGNFAKKNPVLCAHPDALRLVLYYDDLECCTALSPNASEKQKLGAFYLTLDNIDPCYRGNLNTICLVALVNSSFIKEHGIDIVLRRIMLDLKVLETGYVMNGKKIYGTLIAVTGDNAASHALGGFKCGFTAFRLCRTCNATLEEVRSDTKEDPSKLRTINEYEKQIKNIESSKTLKAKDAKCLEYGLTRRCVLNELDSFHVIGGLPQDLQHDLLEGCVARGVKNILNYCIEDLKVATLDWVNSALLDFDYGYSEVSTKPVRIKADHLKEDGHLHQSSSQMWTLATVLPLILGRLIDEEDERWEHFLSLLELCKMVFSNEVRREALPYLSGVISSYLFGYIKFYGPLKAKEHFLCHYATILSNYGSLVDFMCMRMEANHKIFKKFVYTTGNYINIPKSLAIRYQFRQALYWKQSLKKETTYGILKRLKLNEQAYSHLFSGTSEVLECNWIQVNGFLIKSERCYLAIGCDKDTNPIFVKVVNILVWPKLLFVCHRVKTIRCDTHCNAYEIEDYPEFRVSVPSDIVGRRVYHSHNVLKTKYIALKESIKGSF